MTTAALYIRLSSADQGDSIEAQIAVCAEYAHNRELDVVNTYIDDGVSGALKDRPGIQTALTAAEAGEFKHLITRSHRRFARDTTVAGILREEFGRFGVVIHYALTGGAVDPSTEDGKMRNTLHDLMADLERMRIARRTKDGRYRSARRGNILLGGDIPYGYDKIKTDHGNKFEVVPEEAVIVRRVFDEFLAGEGRSQIARGLNEDGIKRHFPGQWKHWHILEMLDRSDYRGIRYYGLKKKQASGKRRKVDPERDDVAKIKVPRIVSDEQWEATQAKRGAMKRKAAGHAKHEYLLKGRVSCVECGSVYLSRTQREVHKYYNHSYDHRECTNAQVHYRCGFMDSYVKEFLVDNFIEDQPNWADAPTRADHDKGAVATIERRLARLDQRVAGFQNMRADGEISAADYSKRVAEMGDLRERLAGELAVLDRSDVVLSDWEPTVRDIEQMEYDSLLIERIDYFDQNEWFVLIDRFDVKVQVVDRHSWIITSRIGEIVVGPESST